MRILLHAGDLRLRPAGQILDAPPTGAPAVERHGAVAVVSIRGKMLKSPDLFDLFLGGGVATPAVTRQIEALTADATVETILLEIDSGGGDANGAFTLADAVARAAREKRVIAYADGLIGSAAYLVASQASEIVTPRDALLGGLGSVVELIDTQGRDEQLGIRRFILSPEGPPHGVKGESLKSEITEAHTAEWLRLLSDLTAVQRDTVARGRQMTAEQASQLFDGRLWLGGQAVERGLADRVLGRHELLHQLTEGDPPMPDEPNENRLVSAVRALAEAVGLRPGETPAAEDDEAVRLALENATLRHELRQATTDAAERSRERWQESAETVVASALSETRATPAMTKQVSGPLATLWLGAQGAAQPSAEACQAAYDAVLSALDNVPQIALEPGPVAGESETGDAPPAGVSQAEAEVNSRHGVSHDRAAELRRRYPSAFIH